MTLASLLESVVRVNGGVPATIGVLNGVARVGLDAGELVELASTAEKKNALKVSRRDLGYICGLVRPWSEFQDELRTETFRALLVKTCMVAQPSRAQ